MSYLDIRALGWFGFKLGQYAEIFRSLRRPPSPAVSRPALVSGEPQLPYQLRMGPPLIHTREAEVMGDLLGRCELR